MMEFLLLSPQLMKLFYHPELLEWTLANCCNGMHNITPRNVIHGNMSVVETTKLAKVVGHQNNSKCWTDISYFCFGFSSIETTIVWSTNRQTFWILIMQLFNERKKGFFNLINVYFNKTLISFPLEIVLSSTLTNTTPAASHCEDDRTQ